MDSSRLTPIPFKGIILSALILIILGIILGAFGAHGLQKVEGLTPKNIDSWKTGVLYQLLMGLGLLILVGLSYIWHLANLKAGLRMILIGASLFSGSIYIQVWNQILDLAWLKTALIPITPAGGLLMIIGWTLILFRIWKR